MLYFSKKDNNASTINLVEYLNMHIIMSVKISNV